MSLLLLRLQHGLLHNLPNRLRDLRSKGGSTGRQAKDNKRSNIHLLSQQLSYLVPRGKYRSGKNFKTVLDEAARENAKNFKIAGAFSCVFAANQRELRQWIGVT
jgi:hypothetical protein